MTEKPIQHGELVLDDPWFADAVPPSEPPSIAPDSVDPELENWFDRGRPLSSRPPPAEAES